MRLPAFTHHDHEPLAIRELAVHPGDLVQETYPVQIRLTRELSPHEAQSLAESLAQQVPHAHVAGDHVVVSDATLDGVALTLDDWSRHLESAEEVGAALDKASHRQTVEATDRLRDETTSHDSTVTGFMH